ncbi:MAG: hypothetical protein LBR38_10175 [Synergistaceae bacterium]|nr:hypothetical protein [Synergistaceae bacterium]
MCEALHQARVDVYSGQFESAVGKTGQGGVEVFIFSAMYFARGQVDGVGSALRGSACRVDVVCAGVGEALMEVGTVRQGCRRE